MSGFEWKMRPKGYEWNKESKRVWIVMNEVKRPKGYEWLWMEKSVQKAMNEKSIQKAMNETQCLSIIDYF